MRVRTVRDQLLALASGVTLFLVPRAARAQIKPPPDSNPTPTAYCVPYIRITQYPASPYYQPTGSVQVQYGIDNQDCVWNGDLPSSSTFRFTVNGVDRTSYFQWGGSQGSYATFSASAVPFVNQATNSFVATITGWDTTHAAQTEQATASTYVNWTPAPVVALGTVLDSRDYGRCAASSFAAMYAKSTVPYISGGTPRAVTLVYNSDLVAPRPYVALDVTPPSGSNLPTKYSLRAQVNGAFVSFMNGEPEVFFQPNAHTVHLAGQLNVSSYATGVYPMQLIASSYFAGGVVSQTTYSTHLVVENEVGSSVGEGWTIAGVQQIYVQADSALLITEGGGNWTYHPKCGANCWVNPTGDFTKLTLSSGAFTRSYTDSSKVSFFADGKMRAVTGHLGDTISFTWSGNHLIQVSDPVRRYNNAPTYIQLNYDSTYLGYGTYIQHGLRSIQEPGADGSPAMGRTTQIGIPLASTLITSITDPDGYVTQFAYDTAARLTLVRGRGGDSTSYAYDGQSGTLQYLDLAAVPIEGRGTLRPRITFSAWQTSGVPRTSTDTIAATPISPDSVEGAITDAGGHTATFTANQWGEPVRLTDALGGITTFSYDAARLAGVIYPSGASVGRDFSGPYVSLTEGSGQPTRYFHYGVFGVVDSVWGPGTPTLHYFLNARGLPDSSRIGSSTGHVTRYIYDGLGRVLSVTDPMHHVTVYHYNTAWGNLDSLLAPGKQFTRVRFDAAGRDSAVQGNLTPWRTTLYDAANRPIKLYDGVNANPTMYFYGAATLDSVRDPKQQLYRFSYNALGWPTQVWDPANPETLASSFGYDVDGEVVRTTNRRDSSITYSYDAIHRLTTTSGGGTLPANFAYSTDDRIAVSWNAIERDSVFTSWGVEDSAATHVAGHRYRLRYHLTDGIWPDTLQISSDAGSLAFPARYFAWDTTTGMLTSVGLEGFIGVAFGFNDDLNVSSWFVNAPNGIAQTDSLLASHRPWAQTFRYTNLANALDQYFGYDSLGRIAVEAVPAQSWNVAPAAAQEFAYDSLGQLRTAKTYSNFFSGCAKTDSVLGYSCPQGSVTASYTYDAAGNRTDQPSQYTTGNRMTAFGGSVFAYDADGNLTYDSVASTGTRRNLSWSADGLLTRVIVRPSSGPADTVQFDYNAAGQLVRRSIDGHVQSYFLWEGGQLLAELDSTGTERVAEYAYYPDGSPHALITGASAATNRNFFIQDMSGNVIGLMRDTIAVAERLWYNEWGTTTDSVGAMVDSSRLRWKGLPWLGDVGLYYVRNRWYDPAVGRFVSEDPIGLEGGINDYTFADDDPINFSDFLGLCPTTYYRDGQPDHAGPDRKQGESGWDIHGNEYTCECDGTQWVAAGQTAVVCGSGDPSLPSGTGQPIIYGGSTVAQRLAHSPFAQRQAEDAKVNWKVCEADLEQTALAVVASKAAVGPVEALADFAKLAGSAQAWEDAEVTTSFAVNAAIVPPAMALKAAFLSGGTPNPFEGSPMKAAAYDLAKEVPVLGAGLELGEAIDSCTGATN